MAHPEALVKTIQSSSERSDEKSSSQFNGKGVVENHIICCDFILLCFLICQASENIVDFVKTGQMKVQKITMKSDPSHIYECQRTPRLTFDGF